jgi:SET domain-containing protein 6
MEAASLAASRAFFIGDECGEALVPWADMFNHKTDGEHVHVLGADADEDEHEDEHDEEEESEEESEEEDEEEEESTDTEEIIEPITGSLVIHVCAAARKGAELFNTFGRQNNASLLHKYGFCEPHNAYTNVCIDAQLVETIVGGTKVRDAALELGVELETEPYFEIEPDGHVEEALLAVLGRAHRTGDAMDDPTTESPEVQASLREILERRMGTYETGRTEEGGGEEGGDVPAGGGLVGAAAARTLRDAERRLLRLAIERNCGGGKKRKKVD